MQKSQCLYLAQGNGILQLEGETKEKEKKNSKINFSGKQRKKNSKREQNSNQKNNNRQNKTQ